MCIVFDSDTSSDRAQSVRRLGTILPNLNNWNAATHIVPILKARVPIIRLHLNQCEVDLSSNAEDLFTTVAWFKAQIEMHPMIKGIALVVKSLLSQQGLMNTQLGGISSTMIFYLVVAFAKASLR